MAMAGMPPENNQSSPPSTPWSSRCGELAAGDEPTGVTSSEGTSSDEMIKTPKQTLRGWWSSGGDRVALQWAYLICAPLLCLVLLYLRQTVDGMGGNELTYTLLILAAFTLYPRGDKAAAEKKDARPEAAPAQTASPDVEQGTSRPPLASPPSRLYYLDNVKSFMTLCVVMHHILIAYGGSGSVNGFVIGNYRNVFSDIVAGTVLGINQSYFMCMFFFISGYFTPSSLLRKGVRDFFFEKFMRLGLPLFAFFFGLNGFVFWFSYAVVMGQEYDNYWQVGTGPPWFLQVLLLFNIAFVVIMGSDQLPTVRCPSVMVIMGLGAAFGLVQGLFIVLDLSMWGIPLAQGSLPFDVLFFCAGCLAKKNKWLEDFQEATQSSRCTLWSLRLITSVLIINLVRVTTTHAEGPFHTVQADGRQLSLDTHELVSMLVWQMLYGLMTMSVSMNVMQLFSTYGNFSNKASKFFSEAAYGVYILHVVVFNIVSYTYVLLLRARDVPVSFNMATDGQIVSSDDIGTWRVVLGFLYTFFISNLILWPLAFYLRKLPGLRNVL